MHLRLIWVGNEAGRGFLCIATYLIVATHTEIGQCEQLDGFRVKVLHFIRVVCQREESKYKNV